MLPTKQRELDIATQIQKGHIKELIPKGEYAKAIMNQMIGKKTAKELLGALNYRSGEEITIYEEDMKEVEALGNKIQAEEYKESTVKGYKTKIDTKNLDTLKTSLEKVKEVG